MVLFWKAIAGTLIAVILGLALGQWENSFTLLISVLVCCMIGVALLSFFVPVLDLVVDLTTMSGIEDNTLRILLKTVGISFIGEIVSLICTDAGNHSIAKVIGFLTTCVVLRVALPIIQQFIDMLKQILGTV
jgi:stage III sporulation protein AD